MQQERAAQIWCIWYMTHLLCNHTRLQYACLDGHLQPEPSKLGTDDRGCQPETDVHCAWALCPACYSQFDNTGQQQTSTHLQPDPVLLYRKGNRRSNAGVVREGMSADWAGGLAHAVHLQQLLQLGVALYRRIPTSSPGAINMQIYRRTVE